MPSGTRKVSQAAGLRSEPLLVLTRRPGQSIVVACEENEVRFKIIWVSRGRVQVGVEAPPNVTILRGELKAEKATV